MDGGDKVVVHNLNVPGWTGKVDRTKFVPMDAALMRVIPRTAPGIIQTEMRIKEVLRQPASLFPYGDKADGWSKCEQLDLEYEASWRELDQKPLRWHRA